MTFITLMILFPIFYLINRGVKQSNHAQPSLTSSFLLLSSSLSLCNLSFSLLASSSAFLSLSSCSVQKTIRTRHVVTNLQILSIPQVSSVSSFIYSMIYSITSQITCGKKQQNTKIVKVTHTLDSSGNCDK